MNNQEQERQALIQNVNLSAENVIAEDNTESRIEKFEKLTTAFRDFLSTTLTPEKGVERKIIRDDKSGRTDDSVDRMTTLLVVDSRTSERASDRVRKEERQLLISIKLVYGEDDPSQLDIEFECSYTEITGGNAMINDNDVEFDEDDIGTAFSIKEWEKELEHVIQDFESRAVFEEV